MWKVESGESVRRNLRVLNNVIKTKYSSQTYSSTLFLQNFTFYKQRNSI
jgi:hypothetical protein